MITITTKQMKMNRKYNLTPPPFFIFFYLKGIKYSLPYSTWKQLGPFVVRALNKAIEDGELSTTQKEGIITCIPTGN